MMRPSLPRARSPWARTALPSLGLLAAVLALGACSETTPSQEPVGAAGGGGAAGAGGAAPWNGWTPADVLAGIPAAPRGLTDVRGLVHAHSVYSHDACDGEPREEEASTGERTGKVDSVCFDDFRRDLCTTQHDFVFLSDHDTSFSYTDFRDALLYRADLGDELVTRGEGDAVANRITCADGRRILLMAGTESNTMPVGLERHVAGTRDERSAVYKSAAPEAIQAMRAVGAVALVAHTEDWTDQQLIELPLQGFEMYNLHANLMERMNDALGLLLNLRKPERLPHSDLVLLPLLYEDPIYLARWGTVLASGVERVTTMGTDCHRNSLPQPLPDGERVDSYRRMMKWFSNHLLLAKAPGERFDDADLKAALAKGRLYGAFEVFGYPEGFDFHAEIGARNLEMGDRVGLVPGGEATLVVTLPSVRGLDPSRPAPALTAKLLRAKEGGWEVVASGAESLRVTVTDAQPGAYRAEIRIVPRHLTGALGNYEALSEKEFPYIYSNALYVRRDGKE